MSTDPQHPISPLQAEVIAESTSPPLVVNEELAILRFHKLFGEASKYTVFAIFAFYSIGFIIWHSYLGSYGVSSVAFLQAEYLAAAFCYLFILATFSVPPILIVKAIGQNIKSKGVRGFKQWNRNWSVIMLVWFYLSSKTIAIFFPDTSPIDSRHIYFWLIFGGVIILHLSAIFVFFFIVGIKTNFFRHILFGKKANEDEKSYDWKASKFYKYLINREYYYLYILVFLMANLFLNPQINGTFLFSCMFLYFSVMASVSHNLTETWNQSGTVLRTIIVTTNCLLLISNIQLFATSEFSKIPKSVGGGKPETAYIKINSQKSNVQESMDIPVATITGLTNGFVGPIGILLRSDKEIIFINYSDANRPDYITNEVVVNITTNLIPMRTNNLVSADLLNHKKHSTNDLATLLQTNITYAVSKNILKNSTKLTARQISSDLIDGIVFTR